MVELESSVVNRRHALGMGGGLATALVAAQTLGSVPALAQSTQANSLSPGVVAQIQQIIQAQGMVSHGVLSIGIDRNDINNVTLRGVPIKPAFEINGALNFQAVGDDGRVIMNSDMALKDDEINPFIDQLLKHDIIMQAEHQHFYDFRPPVWFIHFRALGHPLSIARGVKAALNVTSTPFPQTVPSNPTTPLPSDQLGKILGGDAWIGSDGIVTVEVPRNEAIKLGGIRISPYLNVPATIAFQPHGGGQNAAVAVDFSMTGREIQDVMEVMRSQSWDIGCLYNQETEETPQLFFSHQFKTGDAVKLAHEIRRGLNRTNVKR